ncbi:hypothetical protein [Anaerosolibacter sp.]|uniref:hypothetical protein n=1 Tax=Anaerosolibacter sp. TaxID=1872527 RepID=UPI0039EF51AB
MRNPLNNNDGNAALWACVVVLCLMLVFAGISEYLRLLTITRGVRDAVQASVIAVATQNYDDVYNGLREGYSGGYKLSESGNWTEQVDEGAVLFQLSELLGLTNGEKITNSVVEYAIRDINITLLNTPLAPGNNQKKFEAEVLLNLEVPVSFGWHHLPPFKLQLGVRAGYTPKF